MNSPTRRSTLQTEILGYLRASDAPSVTAIANTLESSRPSVSRSLHVLLDQGLVVRDGRAWIITERGREEAEIALTRLSATTEEMIDRASSRLGVASRLASENMLGSLQANFLGAASAILDGSLARSAMGFLGEDAVNSLSLSSAANAIMPEILRESLITHPAGITIGDAFANLQAASLDGPSRMSNLAKGALSDPPMMDPSHMGMAIDSMQAVAGTYESIGMGRYSDEILNSSPMSDVVAKLAGYANVDVAMLAGIAGVDVAQITGYPDFDATKVMGAATISGLSDEVAELSYLQIPNELARNAPLMSAQSAVASLLGSMSAEDVVSLDRFVAMGTDAITGMALGLTGLDENLRSISATGLIPALPDFEEHFAELERAQKGAEALDRGELDFTRDIWTISFMVQLSEIDEAEQVDWLYERLAEETQNDEYLEDFTELCAVTPVLQRRWPAIQAAMEDHRAGRFYSSIAVMLPQIEGLVNDILLLPGLVRLQMTRVQKIGKNGEKDRYLKGLQDKSELARKALLLESSLAGHIVNKLARDRNGILHGVDPCYADIRQSTRCALILTMLAKTVIKVETRLGTEVA